MHILQYQLQDNLKSHILQNDGTYEKVDKRGKTLFGSQAAFCEEAVAEATAVAEDITDTRVFVPERHES